MYMCRDMHATPTAGSHKCTQLQRVRTAEAVTRGGKGGIPTGRRRLAGPGAHMCIDRRPQDTLQWGTVLVWRPAAMLRQPIRANDSQTSLSSNPQRAPKERIGQQHSGCRTSRPSFFSCEGMWPGPPPGPHRDGPSGCRGVCPPGPKATAM